MKKLDKWCAGAVERFGKYIPDAAAWAMFALLVFLVATLCWRIYTGEHWLALVPGVPALLFANILMRGWIHALREGEA